MRINKWIATQTGLGRRAADDLITQGAVRVNGVVAVLGQVIDGDEDVTIHGDPVDNEPVTPVTLLLNKPRGYVCSRDGQGSLTVYNLLPEEYAHLKIAGRLDRDSSGLLVMSSDGEVIQQLTHPTQTKSKTYMITTRRALDERALNQINSIGVDIGDPTLSQFSITTDTDNIHSYKAVLYEGRNRQIRRTIEALNNQVLTLHRIQIGEYTLGDLAEGSYELII